MEQLRKDGGTNIFRAANVGNSNLLVSFSKINLVSLNCSTLLPETSYRNKRNKNKKDFKLHNKCDEFSTFPF